MSDGVVETLKNPLWALLPRRSRPVVLDADSDEALAERVRASGDTAAFALLVTRYRSRLIALARRLLPAEPGHAEDVAQETLVTAYTRRATFRRGESFRPWLYRIAVNRCLDRQRVLQRRPLPAVLDLVPEPADDEADPLRALLARECDARLEQAVAALPSAWRAVFLLRTLEDMTYEEIAQAMPLPLGTVKTYLFRARAFLRQEMAGYLQDRP